MSHYFLGVYSDHDLKWSAFSVDIKTSNKDFGAIPINVFLLEQDVDIKARRLSLLIPDSEIVVSTMVRVKAVYKNGVRTTTNDLRDFYNNLTEEQIRNTQILCSETHKYV